MLTLPPNFFMHIVVLFLAPSSGTCLASHLMIYVLCGRKLSGEFSIYHIAHVDICCHMLLGVNVYEITWSRSVNFFDSLMASSNVIVQLWTLNVVLNNTHIGLHRKFVSSRHSARTDENKGEKGLLYVLYYTFALTIGILPSFKEMILMY